MDCEAELAKTIQQFVEKQIRSQAPYFTTGVFLGAETEDSNLSQVSVSGNIVRFVPKLSNVTLSPGDTVLMVRAPGIPLIIIGVMVGNITVAEV